jgi:hypothetical protein
MRDLVARLTIGNLRNAVQHYSQKFGIEFASNLDQERIAPTRQQREKPESLPRLSSAAAESEIVLTRRVQRDDACERHIVSLSGKVGCPTRLLTHGTKGRSRKLDRAIQSDSLICLGSGR